MTSVPILLDYFFGKSSTIPLYNICCNFFHYSFFFFFPIALKFLVTVYGLLVPHRALLGGLYKLGLLLAASCFSAAELCHKTEGYPRIYVAAKGIVN